MLLLSIRPASQVYFLFVPMSLVRLHFVLMMQLLELVEQNQLNRSLLTLLDENIANAQRGNQVIAIEKASYVFIHLWSSLYGYFIFMFLWCCLRYINDKSQDSSKKIDIHPLLLSMGRTNSLETYNPTKK